MKKRLKLGIIGGGPGSWIGHVHRIASRFDDEFEIVAGVFSSCLLYTSPSPRDKRQSRMPSSA